MDLDVLEKLFRRASGSGQTAAEVANVVQQLLAQLVKVRPTFLVAAGIEVWRIDRTYGLVTAVMVGPAGLHLRFEHLTSLPALLGGHAVFRPAPGTMLVVPVQHVTLAPGDPF